MVSYLREIPAFPWTRTFPEKEKRQEKPITVVLRITGGVTLLQVTNYTLSPLPWDTDTGRSRICTPGPQCSFKALHERGDKKKPHAQNTVVFEVKKPLRPRQATRFVFQSEAKGRLGLVLKSL